MLFRYFFCWIVWGCVLLASLRVIVAQEPIPTIARSLPPPGIDIPAAQRAALAEATRQLGERLQSLIEHRFYADVAVLHKAVHFALDNGEFFDLKELKLATDLLAEANRRCTIMLQSGDADWTYQPGPTVRGFRSTIDGAWQPYGVVIPPGLKLPRPGEPPIPIYVWLHGRGDKMTDLQFVAQRLTKPGEFVPRDGIVIHPFGRYCNAFKFAGETDVFEAIAHARSQYGMPVQAKSTETVPVVLAGFSMGGAGAWHLGAHYPGVWCAVQPGAGFAETARYQNITPDRMPVSYERTLWGLYDAPGYVRNLLNAPLIAYSGEQDKQIQAALVMESALAAEGVKLDHRIGPGMGHKFHPDVLQKILHDLQSITSGKVSSPSTRLTFQTCTLRYSSPGYWDADARTLAESQGTPLLAQRHAPLTVTGLEQHWHNARVDVLWKSSAKIESQSWPMHRSLPLANVERIETQGVSSLTLAVLSSTVFPSQLTIDGQTVAVDQLAQRGQDTVAIALRRTQGVWRQQSRAEEKSSALTKGPFLQGPIDDAFYDPFLVVTPSGQARHPAVERWVQFELAHFKDRWRRLFRGDLRIKRDTEVTPEDMQRYHLIVWGDPTSNALLRQSLEQLPVQWTSSEVAMGGHRYAPEGHVPVLIYPNPLAPLARKYLVVNSGPTFREGHDSSNSLQTPKLPDWAILDLSVLPDNKSPGRIVDAGFFDEQWRYQPRKEP